MKKRNGIIVLLSMIMVLAACTESRWVEFLKPLKSRTINLTNHLGESFAIHMGDDTLEYQVTYDKATKFNYIVMEAVDTIFEGTVNKLRGMYLLNKELENGNYRIYAMSFDDTTITGLWSDNVQSNFIKEDLKKGLYSKSIIDTTDQYIIYPNRRTGARMFRNALSNLEADYFVIDEELKEMINTEEYIQDFGSNDMEIVAEQDVKAYPNPVMDILKVELDSENPKCEYMLTDISGRQLRSGYLSDGKGTIDCSSLDPGSYFLVFEEQKKVVKIIKQ